MTTRMFANFHQHAYVTTDIEQARQVFAKDFGVKDYLQFDSSHGAEDPSRHRACRAENCAGVCRRLQIELIQPLGGLGVKLYRGRTTRARLRHQVSSFRLHGARASLGLG